MTYSQKYALVHFISPIAYDTQFSMSDWPLHITIADVFAVDRYEHDLDAKLQLLMTNSSPTTIRAIADGALGVTSVTFLEVTPQLQQLHDAIVTLLEQNDATFNHPEFTKKGFIPHSTIQDDSRLNVGDNITLDTVTLVDMFPDDDWRQRKVIAHFSVST